MQEGDRDAVAALAEEAFGAYYRMDWAANADALRKASQAGNVVALVAERDGEVAGYGNLRSWPCGGWIDQIAAGASCRRQGIGRALLDRLLDEARKRGHWRVSLVVSEREEASRAFFAACGLEEAGRLRDEITPGVDGVLMTIVTDGALHPNP
jgi:ribosomal-protein-alanine N-acetyltransferase